MGVQEGENGGDSAAPTDQVKADNLYENRTGATIIIRVITVMAYMVSVSFVAMVLSGYYVFLWQPPNPRLLHRAEQRTDPQIEYRVDDEPVSGTFGAPDRLLEQQSLQNRFSNVSRSASLNDISGARNSTTLNNTRDESNLRRNKTDANDERTASAMDPIIRRVIALTSSRDEASNRSLHRSLNDSLIGNDLESSLSFNRSRNFSQQLGQNLTSSSPRPSIPSTIKTGSHPAPRTATESTFGNDVDVRNRLDKNSLLEMVPLDSRSSKPNKNVTEQRIVIGTKTHGTPEKYNVSTTNVTSGAHEIREDRTYQEFDAEGKSRAQVQPNALGSHITRVPMMRVIANNSADSDKHARNVPIQVASSHLMGDSVGEDMEGTSETSAIESTPQIVQPAQQLSDEEQKGTPNKRLTQEADDFEFI